MSEIKRSPIGEARQLVRELRALGGLAPNGLVADVLRRVGLGDDYFALDSPLGRLLVAYNDFGISAVGRGSNTQQFEQQFRARYARPIRATTPPDDLGQLILDRLSGAPDVPLRFDLRGLSEFERAVLEKALEIPRGEVRPYNWIAREIARPGAVRAVGSALNHNPLPLLISCHRVVHSDGRIGKYVFGPEAKRAVLDAEGAAPDVLESLSRHGVRYLANPLDGSFCYPSCGGLHLRDAGLVPFHTHQQALAAGYHACRDCRPPTG